MKTVSNTAANLRHEADLLSAQWTNGNTSHVLKEIRELTPTKAAYIVAALSQIMLTGDFRTMMSMFLEAAIEQIGPSEMV